MRWFDTHCHLDLIPDISTNVIADAAKVGVDRFVVPGVKGWPDQSQALRELPGVAVAWGVHPMFIDDFGAHIGENIFTSSWQKPVAIGECGLDRRSTHDIKQQLKLFEWQLELAAHLNLPVIVHLVGHSQRAFDLIKKHNVRAVLHSCSCSIEMARRFVAIGCKISLSALHLSTEKKKQFCCSLPDEAILIETDAPDFKPQSWHMKHNHPAALPDIAAELAKERSTSIQSFSQLVYDNSIKFFAL